MKLFFITALGIVFLSVGIYFGYSAFTFKQSAVSVQGTFVRNNEGRDTEGRITYTPVFSYTNEQGEVKEMVSNSYSTTPSYNRGSTATILYDRLDPSDVRVNSFSTLWMVPGLFSFFGLVILIFGFFYYRKLRLDAWLRTNGALIQANVKQVNRSVSRGRQTVNGAQQDTYTYIIMLQYDDTVNNQVAVFYSDPLPFDPTTYLHETVGVYVDPNDFSRYSVDTSFLPTEGVLGGVSINGIKLS